MQQRPDPDAIAAFRARALPFRVIDHEATPAGLFALAGLAIALVAVVAVEGRMHLPDGQTLTPLAMLALVTVAGLALLGAIEAGAWVLSRPLGRELARAISTLEGAHRQVERMAVSLRGDAAFDEAVGRIERAQGDLAGRLSHLDVALVAVSRLPDARLRAAELERIRAHGVSVARAAAVYAYAARLLRASATSPWELTQAQAVAELEHDLARAERLVRDTR